MLPQPVLVPEAERAQEKVQDPECRVKDRVLPDQRGGGRHDKKRADDQCAEKTTPEHVPVQQQRYAEPEEDGQYHRCGGKQDGIKHRRAEYRILEYGVVIVQGGEIPGTVRKVQVPLLKAVIQGQHERELGDQEHEHECRDEWRAANPRSAAGPPGGPGVNFGDRRWRVNHVIQRRCPLNVSDRPREPLRACRRGGVRACPGWNRSPRRRRNGRGGRITSYSQPRSRLAVRSSGSWTVPPRPTPGRRWLR